MRASILLLLVAAACAGTSPAVQGDGGGSGGSGGSGGGGAGGSGGSGAGGQSEPQDLAPLIAPIRVKHGVPGMGAAILDSSGLRAVGGSGVRKQGDAAAVTAGDDWHLGSDTKAMTATLVGMLVDAGSLRWDMTVPELFTGVQADASWDAITLEQLLHHLSGMGDAAEHPDIWSQVWAATDPVAGRAAFVRAIFALPPARIVGKYSYSNFNYIAVGAALEAWSGKSWEELMRTRIFQPLEMTSCGFGPPGTSGKVDEPWGHQGSTGHYVPMDPGARLADNPPTMGPAGTVHCALGDWGKFGLDHLAGAGGHGQLLTAASYAWLHTAPPGSEYAGGWLVASDPRFGGAYLTHDGSNTLWWATIVVALDAGRVYLVTANAGDAAAKTAVGEVILSLPGFTGN